MDQPGLDQQTHHHALDGLRTTNTVSRTAQVIWRRVLYPSNFSRQTRPLRILDIAMGGGDVMIGVAKLAAKRGLQIETHGCDISQTAVDYAQRAAEREHLPGARFFRLNALTDPLPDDYDVVMCTLFLHHLTDADACQLLRRMAQAARRCTLVDDLRRSRLGYLFAWAGARLLTRSTVVYVDGPLSVRAAFTISEMRKLANEAGLAGARFHCHWPERFLMSWSKA